MLTLCQNINAPVKTLKIEGHLPQLSSTILGIDLNTVTMKASITTERKEPLFQNYVICTLDVRKYTKWQL